MKYIFSFFILIVYIIIGFFHNPMVSFAMQESMMMDMKMHSQDIVVDRYSYCLGENNIDNNCDHECCYNYDWISISNNVNTSEENSKILKIKVKNFVDIYAFSISLFPNKNLINKTSPPIILRDVKNYSYKDLIKIIKSNT